MSTSDRFVLRQSKQYIAIGLGLALVGGTFGVAFAASVDAVGAKIAGAVGGLVFVVLGVALVFKSAAERVFVDDEGIVKHSAPTGKRTFKCAWSDVVSYEALSQRTGGSRNYMSVRNYVLNTKFGELRFHALDSYFGTLHSLILSRLPEGVQPKIFRTETPKAEKFEQIEEFSASSKIGSLARAIGFSALSLAMVGLSIIVAFDLVGFEDMDLATQVMGGVFILVFAAVFGMIAKSSAPGRSATYKVTSYGVQRRFGEGEWASIPWTELRSVEYSYEYYDYRTPNERFTTVHSNPEHTYYYVIVGAEGECFYFNSRMKDFGPFMTSLIEHAPLHVALDLHADALSFRRF